MTLTVGQLETNCYIVFDEKNNEGIIIDPGDDADLIIATIQEKQIKPLVILATHGHFDHVMAACELQMAFKIPFYLHQKDQFLLDKLQETAEHFLGSHVKTMPPKQIDYLDPKQSITFGSNDFQIIETPGHTPGSISFYAKTDSVIFVGDLIFTEGGVGRTDFSYCSATDLKRSINEILQLPEETTIYSGHGETTTIKLEMRFHQ